MLSAPQVARILDGTNASHSAQIWTKAKLFLSTFTTNKSWTDAECADLLQLVLSMALTMDKLPLECISLLFLSQTHFLQALEKPIAAKLAICISDWVLKNPRDYWPVTRALLTILRLDSPLTRQTFVQVLESQRSMLYAYVQLVQENGNSIATCLNGIMDSNLEWITRESPALSLIQQQEIIQSVLVELFHVESSPTICASALRVLCALLNVCRPAFTNHDILHIIQLSGRLLEIGNVRLCDLHLCIVMMVVDTFPDREIILNNLTDYSFKIESEFAKIIGLYLYSNQVVPAREAFVNIVKIKIFVSPESYNILQEAYRKKIFTRHHLVSIAQRLVKSNQKLASISFHVTHYLLSEGIFAECHVDPTDIILAMIKSSHLHSLLPTIITLYVDQVLQSKSRMIKWQNLQCIFESSVTESQLAAAYYILVFRESALKIKSARVSEFPEDVLEKIPIHKLFNHVFNTPAVKSIYPGFGLLAFSHYPHSFEPTLFLDEMDRLEEVTVSRIMSVPLDLGETLEEFSKELPRHLNLILNTSTTFQVSQKFLGQWNELYYNRPVNAVQQTLMALSSNSSLLDLIPDPKALIGTLNPMLLSKHLFPIASRILTFAIASFRRDTKQLDELSTSQKESISLLHQSSIIQILLEKAHEPKDPLIYQYIHQMFINEPKLLLLVHYQGYNLEYLDAAVQNIPSLHACFDYIEEFLSTIGDRFVFGMHLAGHLFKKYPVEKSLQITTAIVLPKVYDLGKQVPKSGESSLQSQVFKECLPALTHLMIAFPFLVDSVKSFLQGSLKSRISQTVESLVSLTSKGEGFKIQVESIARIR